MKKIIGVFALSSSILFCTEAAKFDKYAAPKRMESAGYTQLMLAIIKNDFEYAEQILDQNPSQANKTSNFGTTPLMLAVQNVAEEFVHLLLAHEADPEVVSPFNNKTALDLLPNPKLYREGYPAPDPNKIRTIRRMIETKIEEKRKRERWKQMKENILPIYIGQDPGSLVLDYLADENPDTDKAPEPEKKKSSENSDT